MKNIIYYFTGTGNSLAIAKEIAANLGETDIIPLLNLKNTKEIDQKYEKIGFIIPVYYIHAPAAAIEALENLKFYDSQKIFIIATFAGSRGYAVSDIKIQLRKNTKIAIQEFCIRMPGSNISEYSAFPKSIQRFLLNSAAKKVNKIAKTIILDKPTPVIKENLLILLTSKTSLQKNIANFKSVGLNIGQYFHTNDNCSKCRICERICPVQNISVLPASVLWSDKCQQCMACIQWCPKRAIEFLDKTPSRQRYHNPDIAIDELIRK